MDSIKDINVSIYGGNNIFGGKPTKAEAEILSCYSCDKCDVYKRGKCVNGRKVLGKTLWCSEGRVTVIEGYTPRAQKYREFMKKHMDSDVYNAITPSAVDVRVAYIGDNVFINMPWMRLDVNGKLTQDGARVHLPIFISKDKFTIEFIRELLTFVPKTLFEGTAIRDYKEKYVPEFIEDLKKYYPDKYNELIQAVPEYADVEFDYTGRKAYVSTLKDGCTVCDTDSNEFIFSAENMTLTCKKYKFAFKKMLFNKQTTKVVTDVTEDMICIITDNSQVDEHTVFVE